MKLKKKQYLIIPIALLLIGGIFNTAKALNIAYPLDGGTGTSDTPIYGQLLVGNSNGTYTLTSTSSLGIIASSAATSTLLSDNNTFSGTNLFTNALSNFAGTWQTYSPTSLLTAGLDGLFASTTVSNITATGNATTTSLAVTDITGIPYGNGSTKPFTSLGTYLTTDYGGTGTTSPSGILYGDSSTSLKSLKLLGGLVFSTSTGELYSDIAYNLTYFLYSTMSTSSPVYNVMSLTASTTQTTNTTNDVYNGQIIRNWISPVNSPNKTVLPTGVYVVDLYASASEGGSSEGNVYFQVWETDSSGTNIGLIGTSESTIFHGGLTSSSQRFELSFSLASPYTLTSTASRIVLRMIGEKTGVGTLNISTYVGNGSDSHLRIPVANIDTSLFAELNLDNAFTGSNSFTASTTLSGATTTTQYLSVLTGFNLFTQFFASLSDFATYIRGLLSETVTGLDYDNSTGVLSLTSGYEIPTSASSTNWSNFYYTPSSRITAGTNLSWSGNTLNATGGSGTFEWTPTTAMGRAVNATSTELWFQSGFIASSTNPAEIHNTTDAVANNVLNLYANTRGTPADNDQGYISLYGQSDTSGQQEFGRILWEMDDVTNTSKDSTLRFYAQVGNALTEMISMDTAFVRVPSYLTVGIGVSADYLSLNGSSGSNIGRTLKGADSVNFKSILYDGDTSLTANNSGAASYLVPRFSEASSGNHPLIAGMAIKPTTIDIGDATVSDTASLYIEGAATTTTVSGNNYSLWVDDVGGGGTSLIDGQLNLSSSLSGLFGLNSGVSYAVSTSSMNASITGNAGTATALATPRAINGTDFDGTAPITITAASSTLLADNNTFSGTNNFTENLGLGTTTPYAKLSVVGETVSSYFTATSTTATSTLQKLTVSTGLYVSGFLDLFGTSVTSFASLVSTIADTLIAKFIQYSTSFTATTAGSIGINTASGLDQLQFYGTKQNVLLGSFEKSFNVASTTLGDIDASPAFKNGTTTLGLWTPSTRTTVNFVGCKSDKGVVGYRFGTSTASVTWTAFTYANSTFASSTATGLTFIRPGEEFMVQASSTSANKLKCTVNFGVTSN